MYFTYCQLWIPVVAAAFYDDFIIHRAIKWAKTERYQVGTAYVLQDLRSWMENPPTFLVTFR